jgi:tetratricopeptide (TPR) repeat protein
MFLALCLPAQLYLCFKSTGIYSKIIRYLMVALALIGLVLLECRTALLGGLFSSGLYLLLHFRVRQRLGQKRLFVVVLLVGILAIPVGRQLYLHKKNSADGRQLIWKLSWNMVQNAPWSGYGTGMFEKEYNLKQAQAIEEGKLNQKELKNASFVLMAYNDYLEQAIEGGILAVVLFMAMLASFLYPFNKNKAGTENETNQNLPATYVAYTGIAAFGLMAIFNFILQAIPVMWVFCGYAAILCTKNESLKITELHIKQPVAKTALFLLFCFTVYFTFGQLTQAKEYQKIKKAKDFLESGAIFQAESLLVELQKTKQTSTSFCIIYGNLLFAQNKYSEALEQFECAKKYSSNPILFDLAAQCQFKLKNYKEAISNLYQLTALSPKTIKYKFQLMQLLVFDKQIKQACVVAQKIVKMPVINANKQTDKYIKEAEKKLKIKN